jgi:hypothetical protein
MVLYRELRKCTRGNTNIPLLIPSKTKDCLQDQEIKLKKGGVVLWLLQSVVMEYGGCLLSLHSYFKEELLCI